MKQKDLFPCLPLPGLRSRRWLLPLLLLLVATMVQAQPRRVRDTSMRKGLYLGVIGFNKELFEKPVGILSQDNKSEYTGFVNALSNNDNHTALYYAVDCALDKLQTTPLPGDLMNVSIITFTDGHDNYSGQLTGNRDKYDDEMFGDTQHSIIQNTTVNGQPLTAYAIGLSGTGTGTSNDAIAEFEKSLKNLSSSDDKWKRLSNMSAVSTEFQSIANSLKTVTYLQDIKVEVNVKKNRRYLFTLDNSQDGSKSGKYIEVVLKDVTNEKAVFEIVDYKGVVSHSMPVGSVVEGILNANDLYQFTFTDIQVPSGGYLAMSNPSYIDYHESTLKANGTDYFWYRDTEFDKSKIDITDVSYSCAVILLVLDCTSSLTEFASLKTAVNNFITTLASKAHNEPERVIIAGDVNGDEQVDGNDVDAILDFLLGESTPRNQGEADVDGDGRITINDPVMFVKKYMSDK